MTYFWILVAIGVTMGVMIWRGRLVGDARTRLASAMVIALSGYALQGHPMLPGKPVAAPDEPEGFGEAIRDQRRGMSERFGPAAQWLGMSDGFMRTGKTRLAAQTLEKALEKYPDNVDLWVGLGNALVAHGGGMMSPAASLAFDEAARRDPAHPAPPFFEGLAKAQSGDFTGAERVWSDLLARSPDDAPWRPDLEQRLTQLRAVLEPAPPNPSEAG
ncbi:tetratricopeptide repeat protein [Sphingopyxis sp. MWB1]|uniref:tetratricopeptide repeat protein n=1 Tax=Sphingopyxis sp. MWB1 TaxID=1537715 RepID=UPI00068C1F36|nr:tetratricopeptide repeat protein [Sphingopyxis sp. MWB1]